MTETGNQTPANQPDDELMTRLRNANPVPPSSVDELSSPSAETLFEQITSRPAGFAPYSPSSPVGQPLRPGSEAPDPRSAADQPRRWGLLAAVAAVAVLLIGALVIAAPGGTQPALAVVQSAAAETADANSGRVVTEFSVVGHEDAEHGTLAGTMTATFDDENFAVNLDVDPDSDVMSAEEAAEIGQAETRLVDGQLYATVDGQEWMSIEAPEILQSTLTRLTDLRSILAEVEELVEVEEIGPAEIDGQAVTRYQSEVDLADESLAESGWLPGTQGMQSTPVDIDAQGLVTIDLYVDANGLMRRIEVSGQAEPVDTTIDASADFTITTNFVDLNSDVVVEAPDPSMVETFDFDPSSVDSGLSDLDD